MCPNFVGDHLFSISSDTILLLSFLSPSQTGAVGHADSLSPLLLPQGKLSPPVIQSSEHGVENVCMCLRVCSRETVTVWGETKDRIY